MVRKRQYVDLLQERSFVIGSLYSSMDVRASLLALHRVLFAPRARGGLRVEGQTLDRVNSLAAQLWCRCRDLKRAGWLRGKRTGQYGTIDCTPNVGHLLDAGRYSAHECKVYSFCPWCWCRKYVKPTIIHLRHYFQPHFDLRAKAAKAEQDPNTIVDPMQVLTIVKTFRFPALDNGSFPEDIYSHMLQFKESYSKRLRGFATARGFSLHGYWMQSVAPYLAPGQYRGEPVAIPSHWEVQYRFIGIWPREVPPPANKMWRELKSDALMSTCIKLRDVRGPASLVPIVGNLFRYPEQLLQSRFLHSVLSWLNTPLPRSKNGRSPVCLFSHNIGCGVFTDSAKEKQVQADRKFARRMQFENQ